MTALLCLATSFLLTLVAIEPPSLALAELQISRAELRAALDTLEALTLEGPLDRRSLVRVLTVRVQLYAALKRPEELMRDATALAALDPAGMLENLRPDARAAVVDARNASPAAPDIRVVVDRGPLGLRLHARTTGPPSLLRAVWIEGRPASGVWQRSESDTLVLPTSTSTTFEYHAALVGPGGAILARDGAPSAPRRWSEPPVGQQEVTPLADEPTWWPYAAVGAAVVVGAVVVGIVVAGNNADTQLVVDTGGR